LHLWPSKLRFLLKNLKLKKMRKKADLNSGGGNRIVSGNPYHKLF
jgi:hypothetical protein